MQGPKRQVTRQIDELSSLPAAGQMLTEGQHSEDNLIDIAGMPCDPVLIAQALGPDWTLKAPGTGSVEDNCKAGPWIAEMIENNPANFPHRRHAVVVDEIALSGNLMVRDSWEGTTYEMHPAVFMAVWSGRGIFRNRKHLDLESLL
ncbi:MAG: hypothetical protein IAF58_21820 [Leptolyngbya sp.]|nr:hypothetical protein [Candidatus Melainabacteria bacterium]